jgi:hypothetical protein
MTTTIESALTPIHDRWLTEVRCCVEPATLESAEFWDRWSAVRYLADPFRSHFRLERALLAAIAEHLSDQDAERLAGKAGELERLLSRLDRAGRRQDSAPAVAADARRLVAEVSAWCAALQRSTMRLRKDAVSPETLRALEQVASSGALAIS